MYVCMYVCMYVFTNNIRALIQIPVQRTVYTTHNQL